MNTETTASPVDNHAMILIQRQRAGGCLEDLSEHLRKASMGVLQTGKKATVTLTITIAPVSEGVRSMVNIEDKVTSNVPKPKADFSIFYIGKGGDLSREDVRQKELDFEPPKVVPAVSTRAGGPGDNFDDERRGDVAPPPPVVAQQMAG